MAGRRREVAKVSDEAHRGWKNFARKHNVTQAALAEAIGLFLEENKDTPRHRLPTQLRRCIDKALDITFDHKQRGNGGD